MTEVPVPTFVVKIEDPIMGELTWTPGERHQNHLRRLGQTGGAPISNDVKQQMLQMMADEVIAKAILEIEQRCRLLTSLLNG